MRNPLIIVIPASDVTQENAWMKENIDPVGGQYTFTSSLSDDGVNVTHYWCSGQWDDTKAVLLKDHFAHVYTGTPQEALDDMGLQRFISI
jgi:hypothetical protein